MGITNFFGWLKKRGYLPRTVELKPEDKLAVDAKLLMNKIMYSIPVDCEDMAEAIAEKIHSNFKIYKHVTFVNDGFEVPVLKLPTLAKRQDGVVKAKQRAEIKEAELKDLVETRKTTEEDVFSQFVNDASQKSLQDDVDRKQRQARKVNKLLAMKVLTLLETKYNFQTVQCEGEADGVLAKMAADYTYVVTEDSDLIAYGVNNLLRFFGTQNLLFCDVLPFLKVSLREFQEMVTLAGCDYCGIKDIGLRRAYDYIKSHKTVEHFLASKDAKKYEIPENFLEIVEQVIQIFSPPSSPKKRKVEAILQTE